MMIHKMNHIYTYMHNAEFNCRLEKYPFLGMPDDGKFHDFDDIWKGVQKEKKSGNDYKTRMDFLNLGFQRYIEDFYFKSEVNLKTKIPISNLILDHRGSSRLRW